MAFFWGQNGQQISTPEQAKRARTVAESLINQPKATNWGEGLARVTGAYAANQINDRVGQAETEGAQSAAASLAQLGSGASQEQIIAALSNPWLSGPQSQVASALLQNNLAQQDPLYQIQRETAELQLDALRNPQPIMADPFTLGRGEIRFDGNGNVIAEGTPYSPDTVVNNNLGNTNDFFTGLQAAEGENFQGFLAGGQTAARNLGQIDQLESLLANSATGLEGAATQLAGEFGIDLGGASGVQAAQALINQMVPAQRQPGSGPMSDKDLEIFKASLPRIINQPGGNALIIQTLRAINAYDMELARITQQGIADAERTQDPNAQLAIKQRMREEINSLQNPITPFMQRVGQTPTGQATMPQGVTIRKISD